MIASAQQRDAYERIKNLFPVQRCFSLRHIVLLPKEEFIEVKKECYGKCRKQKQIGDIWGVGPKYADDDSERQQRSGCR